MKMTPDRFDEIGEGITRVAFRMTSVGIALAVMAKLLRWAWMWVVQ